MSKHDTLPILIAGSTASGKSALALALAEEFHGCIINADSMQVYDVLRCLTARPSQQEEAQAPHRLYGHVSPNTPYSVGRWQEEAMAEIHAAKENGQTPIIIGGTGLYFKSLTQGLSEIPAIDDAVRRHWRDRLENEGSAELHAVLMEIDSDLAKRIAPKDRQRILRGLEVFDATGETLTQWQTNIPTPPLHKAHKILLMPDRDWLYARCNLRFEKMISETAKAEVANLIALKVPNDMPIMKALGVKEIAAYLNNNMTLEDAIEQAQQATRRYAKRQMTWFRNQMTDWTAFSEKDYIDNYHKIFSFITKNGLTA